MHNQVPLFVPIPATILWQCDWALGGCANCPVPPYGQDACLVPVSQPVLYPRPNARICWGCMFIWYTNLYWCCPLTRIWTVTMGMLAFLGEYTSLALAKVWTGVAKLPSKQTMQDEHLPTIEKHGGYGKDALYLPTKEFISASLPQSLSYSWTAHGRQHMVLDWMVEHGGCQVWWQASQWNTQRVMSVVCFRGEHDWHDGSSALEMMGCWMVSYFMPEQDGQVEMALRFGWE